jgi:hypothetical protein
MMAVAVCSILAVSLASAQSPIGSTFQDQNPTEPHHFRIYQMMKDMTQEMTKMTEQMSQGAPTPDQQKQMAKRMQSMSAIMHRLSGLEARPAIKHGDMDKQLDQTRKQMDQMRGKSIATYIGVFPSPASRCQS